MNASVVKALNYERYFKIIAKLQELFSEKQFERILEYHE